MKIPIYLFAAATLMAGNVIASAQSYRTAVPGIPGATIYTGAPEGFDPITASTSELDAYGYPTRPDPGDTEAYALWVRVVSTTRVIPTLVATNRYHQPNQIIGKSADNDNTLFQSGNWSGYSLIGKSGSQPFDEAVGQWYVPNIGATSKSITGYSSEWVGIDGNGTYDIIQDGTEADWYGGGPHYYAWIEFFPNSEDELLGFSVAPGDLISAYSEKEVVGGKVTGKYFIANLSTNKSFSGTLPIPGGASFYGQSVEWIVERTEVGDSYTNPLPRYAMTYMNDAWAYKSGSNTKILYSTQPNSIIETNENMEMFQGSTELSSAFGQDSSSIWFQWHNY